MKFYIELAFYYNLQRFILNRRIVTGDAKVYETLNELSIPFEYYEHPPAPTVEIAMQYWKMIPATHCKNLFFRNHKGNKHYLVIIEANKQLDIHEVEKMLKEGKLSFASEQRIEKYLGLKPGSVSPFGLIHDTNHEVIVFLDEDLRNADKVGFHPNLNTASIVISYADLIKFFERQGNVYNVIRIANKTD